MKNTNEIVKIPKSNEVTWSFINYWHEVFTNLIPWEEEWCLLQCYLRQIFWMALIIQYIKIYVQLSYWENRRISIFSNWKKIQRYWENKLTLSCVGKYFVVLILWDKFSFEKTHRINNQREKTLCICINVSSGFCYGSQELS